MCCAFHAVCWIVGLFVWSFISCCIYRLFIRSYYNDVRLFIFELILSHIISVVSIPLIPVVLLFYPIYRLSNVVDKYEVSINKKD